MGNRKSVLTIITGILGVMLFVGPVMAQKPTLDAWKPNFDPSGAKYTLIASNVSHPAIKGTYSGFALRDELWKRTNGQIFVDYKPFSMLGGEVEVLNQLQMGAIQGMSCSSVASTNLGPRFGIVNLPFLIDSNEKLEKFIADKKLFDHFLMAMDHQGIMALDITTYGSYGWASTIPIKSINDMNKNKFRIAEAAVNQLTYTQWGVNPVPMPWPDVPVALKQGVITALDHTDLVCDLTKKFEVAKYFTAVSYAKGLFIWIFNKNWVNSLPPDLRETFVQTVHDVSAEYRRQGAAQEEEIRQKIIKEGIQVFELPENEVAVLRTKGNVVHEKYAAEINKLYPGDTYRPENFLKEVQDLVGYKP